MSSLDLCGQFLMCIQTSKHIHKQTNKLVFKKIGDGGVDGVFAALAKYWV